MKNKKIVLAVGCAVGGCFIGFFANHLSTPIGVFIFALGALILAVSIFKISKDDK